MKWTDFLYTHIISTKYNYFDPFSGQLLSKGGWICQRFRETGVSFVGMAASSVSLVEKRTKGIRDLSLQLDGVLLLFARTVPGIVEMED